MCGKCSKMCGSLILVGGILFLLQDLGVWNFWGISWYTYAFILAGIGMHGKSCCKDCCAMNEAPKTKKK